MVRTGKSMISVIIPVYNSEKYLKSTIQSVIEQDYRDIEIILVNDGSTDDSLSICKQLQSDDSRIHIINQENSGVSAARNNGIRHAHGEYLIFIDADDLMDKDMLSVLYEKAIETDADIVSCGAAIVKDGMVIREEFGTNKLYTYSRDEAIKFFLIGNNVNIGVWTKLFKAKTIKGIEYDKAIRINEDKLFIFEALMKAEKYVVYDVSKYNYIQREVSATRKFDDRWFDTLDVADYMLELIKKEKPELLRWAEINQIKVYYWLLLMLFRNHDAVEMYSKQYNRVVCLLKKAKLLKISKYISRNMFLQILLIKVSEPLFKRIKGRG